MRLVIYTLLLVCSTTSISCNASSNYFSNRELALQNVKSIIVTEKESCIPEYVLQTADGVLFYRLKMNLSISCQREIKYLLQSYQAENNITHAEFIECCKKVRRVLHDSGVDVAVNFTFNDKFNDVAILSLEKKKIGRICVNGSSENEKDSILSYLSQIEGEDIDRNALTSSLDNLNNNYYQKGEIEFLESENGASTDVMINMEDKRVPIATFGMDNYGIMQNQPERVYLGINLFNVLGSSHNVSFLTASSNDFASYRLFDFDYKYSYGKRSAFNFLLHLEDLHGKSTSSKSLVKSEGRYHLSLINKPKSQQKIVLGSFYNTTNTDAFIGGEKKFDQNISSMGLLASLESYVKLHHVKIKSNVTTYIQPKSILKSGSLKRYKESGNIDRNTYSLLVAKTHLFFEGPSRIAGSLQISGQYAITGIPSFTKFSLSKQNGMGGYKSEPLLFDSGLIAHWNLFYKSFSPIKYLIRNNRDFVNVGAFFDLGLGKDRLVKTSKIIAACGPKVEFNLFTYLQAAISVEFPLMKSKRSNSTPDLNFRVSTSY